MDHNLTGDRIFSLPELLNSSWCKTRHLLPVFEGYPIENGKWRWENLRPCTLSEKLLRNEQITLEGPNGFIGHVGKYALSLFHAARWYNFVENGEIRRKLQGLCIHVAIESIKDNPEYKSSGAGYYVESL